MISQNNSLIKNYDPVAGGYAYFNYKNVHSAIVRSKMIQLEEIAAGQNVLFAGSGPGEDALAAAQKGAQITCLDVSDRMLTICAQKFNENGLEGRFINANVMDHTDQYDAVIANFFLNVFDRPTVQTVLDHLATLLVPKGMLMIADVSPLRGNPLYRAITFCTYLSVAAPAALIGLTALHVPYEYNDFFGKAGIALKWETSFPNLKIGPPLYKTWAAEKK